MCQIGTAGHLQSGLPDRFVGQVSYSMSLLYITIAQTAAWPNVMLLCHGIVHSGVMLEPLLN